MTGLLIFITPLSVALNGYNSKNEIKSFFIVSKIFQEIGQDIHKFLEANLRRIQRRKRSFHKLSCQLKSPKHRCRGKHLLILIYSPTYAKYTKKLPLFLLLKIK